MIQANYSLNVANSCILRKKASFIRKVIIIDNFQDAGVRFFGNSVIDGHVETLKRHVNALANQENRVVDG